MSTLDDYNAVIGEITQIPDSELGIQIGMPLGIYIQFTENLHKWCISDKEALIKVGLDWKTAESLPIRAGAWLEGVKSGLESIKSGFISCIVC